MKHTTPPPTNKMKKIVTGITVTVFLLQNVLDMIGKLADLIHKLWPLISN